MNLKRDIVSSGHNFNGNRSKNSITRFICKGAIISLILVSFFLPTLGFLVLIHVVTYPSTSRSVDPSDNMDLYISDCSMDAGEDGIFTNGEYCLDIVNNQSYTLDWENFTVMLYAKLCDGLLCDKQAILIPILIDNSSFANKNSIAKQFSVTTFTPSSTDIVQGGRSYYVGIVKHTEDYPILVFWTEEPIDLR